MESARQKGRHCVMPDKVMTRFKKPRPKYYFKEWRKHRGMTQEDLAAAIGTHSSSISQLETGKQGFSDTTLLAIADALSCTPADLLTRDPSDPEHIFTLWDMLDKREKELALNILRSVRASRKTGTNG